MMNTKIVLETLKRNLDKELLFEYSKGKYVKANYHITEIKNIAIESVDCGGKENSWNETVVQLWENPLEIKKRSFMKVSKAVEIFEKVHAIKPLKLETIIKFEYGNNEFHTANLNVESVVESKESLIVKLRPENTQCKAVENCCPSEIEEDTVSAIENCCC